MNIVGQITSCSQCGKSCNKSKLLSVEELWGTSGLCKDCYQKHQLSLWGFW